MKALFEDFSASNALEWKERLVKDLKGTSFEDLCQQDRNGITIKPFYTQETADKAQTLFTHTDWIICAAIQVADPKLANKEALNELQNGAAGLLFYCDTLVDFSILLQDIQLPYIYCKLIVKNQIEAFTERWYDYLTSQNIVPESLHYSILYDPIQQYLQAGQWEQNLAQQNSKQQITVSKTLNINALVYQNAGANTNTQLACTLAQINEYLNWAATLGYLEEIQTLNISFSTGTDFFEEIAKLRALRILINNLLQQYGCTAKLQLDIETSDTYRSPFDAYSNLLRDSIAGMAAVLGGCTALSIHRFDQYKNEPSEFSTRMARNQQLIFKEESYLNEIADAAAGSFFLETLTKELSEKAWTAFKEIEKAGGLIAYFEKGTLKESIAKQAQEWIKEYQSGAKVLIGVNKFIDANDAPTKIQQQAPEGNGLQTINIATLLP